jgi:hypothetical protein
MMSRVIRLVTRGPGALRSRAAQLAVSLLAVAGVAMLAWSAVIHLQLWADGYRDIPSIGPLFLAQGVGCIALGLVILVFRWLALLAAGAVTLAATAAGLLVSVHVGLLGYRESLAVPYAMLSLQVEFTGAAVLLAGAVLLAAAPVAGAAGRHDDPTGKHPDPAGRHRDPVSKQREPDEPGNPSAAPFRT